MQIVFVHQNFPAQFGHVANYLGERHGHDCIFASRKKMPNTRNIKHIHYDTKGGATAKSHYCSRSFENSVWHSMAIYEALTRHPGLNPDLIVGHSGFGSTLFLREKFKCPIINYFEYFYHSKESDMDFRPDFPSREMDHLRSRARNAMILLDLHNCARGYSPTRWQHSHMPPEYKDKVKVLFDGIDTKYWRPCKPENRQVAGWMVPRGCRLVTYATRGMESMRGFDIFMNVAYRLCKERSDIVFAIAGEDRVCYGGDHRQTGGKSLKEYLVSIGNFDMSRFRFLGMLAPTELAKLFSLSDLHFYFTVPFILSWSVFNALACGTTILASDTAPVRELIQHEHSGLLVDFFDEDAFVDVALKVLKDPQAYRFLGANGRAVVDQQYSFEACLPKLAKFYQQVAEQGKPVAPSDLPEMISTSSMFK